MGPARGDRCRDLSRVAIDAAGRCRWPSDSGSTCAWTSAARASSPSGLAMATGRPTVICVTSGTAAAELHPAVVEAHHARVPLIVCTADRPPELHDTGAPQTIDQVGLFGSATRWAHAPGRARRGPGATSGDRWPSGPSTRRPAGRTGPGPVHLNLAFREPLTGHAGRAARSPGPRVVVARPRRRPDRPRSSWSRSGAVGSIIVGGPWLAARRPPRGCAALADRLGWPVLADPLSGCRLAGTIAAADAIVRTRAAAARDASSLLGAPWLSKALGELRRRGRRAPGRGSSSSTRGGSGPTRSAWPPSSTSAPADDWLRGGRRRRRQPCDPEWLGVVADHGGRGRRRPSTTSWAPI